MTEDSPNVSLYVLHHHRRLLNIVQHYREPLFLIRTEKSHDWHVTAVETEAGTYHAFFSNSFELLGSNHVGWRLNSVPPCK